MYRISDRGCDGQMRDYLQLSSELCWTYLRTSLGIGPPSLSPGKNFEKALHVTLNGWLRAASAIFDGSSHYANQCYVIKLRFESVKRCFEGTAKRNRTFPCRACPWPWLSDCDMTKTIQR